MQKNEGGWDFSLEESTDGRAIELDVAVGRFLDSSLIKADVQPHLVRLLIKAWLLSSPQPFAHVHFTGDNSLLLTPLSCRGTCCSYSCPKRSGQTKALH